MGATEYARDSNGLDVVTYSCLSENVNESNGTYPRENHLIALFVAADAVLPQK